MERDKGLVPLALPTQAAADAVPTGPTFAGATGYLRPNTGVNTTNGVKISSRPSSIAKMHTQVWASLSTESEFQHLQRLGELDQFGDVIGDLLLGADRVIDGEIIFRKQEGTEKILRGRAGDAGRHMKKAAGDLAGHQIGLIGLRHRDQQVGILDARLAQRRDVKPRQLLTRKHNTVLS